MSADTTRDGRDVPDTPGRVDSCREEIGGGGGRCHERAEFILWGKLFAPAALGPRCYDHAAVHIGWGGMGRIDQYAVFDLRRVAAHPAPDTICSCGNRFDGDNLCMVSACQWEGIEPTPDAATETAPGLERGGDAPTPDEPLTAAKIRAAMERLRNAPPYTREPYVVSPASHDRANRILGRPAGTPMTNADFERAAATYRPCAGCDSIGDSCHAARCPAVTP